MLQGMFCNLFNNCFSRGNYHNKSSAVSLFLCFFCCLFVYLFFVVKKRDDLYFWKFEKYFWANTLLLRGRYHYFLWKKKKCITGLVFQKTSGVLPFLVYVSNLCRTFSVPKPDIFTDDRWGGKRKKVCIGNNR